MKTANEPTAEADRHDRLAKQVEDRELRQYHEGKASEIRKQLEAQRIFSAPEIERAARRFMADLSKAGIRVTEVDLRAYPDKVTIEAR